MMHPETVNLGGRSFTLNLMPWGRLKKLAVVFNRVGLSLSAGVCDEVTLDDVTLMLSIALDLPVGELDRLATTQGEVHAVLQALMRVSGLKAEMEYQQNEAIRRAVALQQIAIAAAAAEPGATAPV